MKIKSILKILSEVKYMKSVLHRYGDSLARGTYYQHASFRAFSLDEPSTRERAAVYFDKGVPIEKKKAVAEALNKIGFYKNRNKNRMGDYQDDHDGTHYYYIYYIAYRGVHRQRP